MSSPFAVTLTMLQPAALMAGQAGNLEEPSVKRMPLSLPSAGRLTHSTLPFVLSSLGLTKAAGSGRTPLAKDSPAAVLKEAAAFAQARSSPEACWRRRLSVAGHSNLLCHRVPCLCPQKTQQGESARPFSKSLWLDQTEFPTSELSAACSLLLNALRQLALRRRNAVHATGPLQPCMLW